MSVSHTAPAARGGERIVLIVVGALIVLVGLASLIGGGVLVGIHATKRDGEGFYTSGSNRVATSTHALVAEGLTVGDDGPNFLFRKGRLATLRITAESAGKPIFVGVARRGDMRRYLRGVSYDEVKDLELGPLSLKTERHAGTAAAAPPSARRIWTSSATGVGRQVVRWNVRKGDWAAVVMNADRSPGVDATVSVGAKVPFLLWLGIALAAAGAAVLAGGSWLIFLGGRRRPSALRADAALGGAAS